MTDPPRSRVRSVWAAPMCALLLLLSACELGSTDVAGGETGPTTTAPTGPTEATGPTVPTGPTADAVLEGTWSGTWDTDVPQVKGTFSWVIEATPNGFTGTIEVQNTTCISNGTVDVALDDDRITVGLVQAEEPVTFTGTISGDRMSGTYDAGTCPPPNSGTWQAVRSV
jgi:hypothetical protein